MFGTRLLVNGVDSIYDIDNILNGDRLVGTQYHTGVADAWLDTRSNEGLEAIDISRCVVDLEIMILVDIDRYILFGHSLAAAFGQKQFDGVGADERRSHHEEHQQQEHEVGHGGAVLLNRQFVSRLYHGLLL